MGLEISTILKKITCLFTKLELFISTRFSIKLKKVFQLETFENV